MTKEKLWGTWQSKGTKSQILFLCFQMVLVLKFLLPNHIHSTLILKELEELLEYKHNSWIFDIAPKAYIYYSYKLMFFFSLGTLKVYLMYEEKKSLQLSWCQQLHQDLTKLSSLLADNFTDFQNLIYFHLEA